MQNGILLLLLSMALTPIGDGVSKAVGATVSPFFIVWARYLAAGLVGLAVLAALRRPLRLPEGGLGPLIGATALVMGAMALLTLGLTLAPLAEAVGGFLIAPVAASCLAALVLRERLDRARILGAALSAAGALLVARPSAGLSWGTLAALGGGLLLAAYLVLTRRMRPADPVSTLALQCLGGGVMLAPLALIEAPAAPLAHAGPLALLGLVTAACHFLTVAAYARAEASVLSPFLYFNLLAAVLVGWLWFGELPDAVAALGLAAIATGGLIVALPRAPLPAAHLARP